MNDTLNRSISLNFFLQRLWQHITGQLVNNKLMILYGHHYNYNNKISTFYDNKYFIMIKPLKLVYVFNTKKFNF